MTRIIRKLSYFLLTLFLAIVTIFFIIRLSPGDPVERILGPEASQVEVQRYREQLGLNDHVIIQFGEYLQGFISGELGKSLYGQQDVTELLSTHMPATITLAVSAIVFSAIIGIFVGLIAAVRKSYTDDYIIRVITLVALAFPIFSLAPILVLIFAIQLRWFPVSEWTSWEHMVLPTLTLVIPLSAIIVRVMRNRFLEEFQSPWIMVLYAKGLRSWDVWMRVAKVCLPTVFNVLAIQMSVVLAGTMITETIFDIPGVGTLLFEAIQSRDYPVVQGAIIYSTTVYMMIYFLVDYVNEMLDPRLQEGDEI